jgi:hypothetical protein
MIGGCSIAGGSESGAEARCPRNFDTSVVSTPASSNRDAVSHIAKLESLEAGGLPRVLNRDSNACGISQVERQRDRAVTAVEDEPRVSVISC